MLLVVVFGEPAALVDATQDLLGLCMQNPYCIVMFSSSYWIW